MEIERMVFKVNKHDDIVKNKIFRFFTMNYSLF